MKTIDEMFNLRLLTSEEHHKISAWVSRCRTPEAILAMPGPLWQAIERASIVMNIDADLTRPPALGW